MQYPFNPEDRVNWWSSKYVYLLAHDPLSFTYSGQKSNHKDGKFFFKQAVWKSKLIKVLI